MIFLYLFFQWHNFLRNEDVFWQASSSSFYRTSSLLNYQKIFLMAVIIDLHIQEVLAMSWLSYDRKVRLKIVWAKYFTYKNTKYVTRIIIALQHTLHERKVS